MPILRHHSRTPSKVIRSVRSRAHHGGRAVGEGPGKFITMPVIGIVHFLDETRRDQALGDRIDMQLPLAR